MFFCGLIDDNIRLIYGDICLYVCLAIGLIDARIGLLMTFDVLVLVLLRWRGPD